MVKIHVRLMRDLNIFSTLGLGLPVAPNVVPLAPIGTTPIINFLPSQSPNSIASGNPHI